MKTLFFTNELINQNTGVGKKIISQYKAMSKHVDNLSLVKMDYLNGRYVRLIDSEVVDTFNAGKIGILESFCSYNNIIKFVKKNNIQLVYIRYTHFSNPFFIKFLKKLKNQSCKIVIEIPTYPYDAEYIDAQGLRKIKFYFDIIFRKFIKNYIDKVITFSADKKIWNIDCINISNAVDPDDIPMSTCQKTKSINFIGVANLKFWHGYDRIIKSLSTYNKQSIKDINIYIHIVGTGDYLNQLENQVINLQLQNFVFFHGDQTGDSLSKIFNSCNIGIDSLARHRSNNETNNSLKSKEYLMRGIPFLKSHIDVSIDDSSLYYQIDPSDDEFDLREIIYWYNNLNANNIAIRKFAESRFTWDIQFDKIFEILYTDFQN